MAASPDPTPADDLFIDLTADDAGAPCHRVLIVDDRPELRLLLRLRLEFEPDIDVVGEASNGMEAVELTKLLSPAAVVLDLEMPKMNGDEAIPLMRAASPGTGILLYTATPGTVAPEAAPDASVQKGVPLDVVVATLRQVLQRTPFDVVRMELGTVALEQAVTAFDTWVGLNVRVLETLRRGEDLAADQLGDATREELEALTGVYAHIGHSLQKAARAGSVEVNLVIHIFRTSGVLARRALLAYDDRRVHAFWQAWGYDVPTATLSALSHMRERLLSALPASAGAGGHAHATAT